MATAEQIAWAAGLFEGEGCITVGAGNLKLCLNMTDRDVVERFAAIVGAGTIAERPRRMPHHKPQYHWRLTGHREAEAVLAMLLPYLGKRRRARAEELRAQLPPFFEEVACDFCGERFRPVNRSQRFCCERHAARALKQRNRAALPRLSGAQLELT